MKQASPQELLGRQLNDVESKFAPTRLYYQGRPELAAEGVRVSVVGTREPSTDGKKRAQRLTSALAENGFVVVSGLARGIDTAAHQAAIRAGGSTVAIVGSGLDVSYPKENAELQAFIARHHLLVSQFPPGTAPQRGNFPQRNRTMALICDATVIVEAREKSGTESQGWEALRLGRSVFFLRSLLEQGLSWPDKMMNYGARELAEIDDILDVLPPAVSSFDLVHAV